MSSNNLSTPNSKPSPGGLVVWRKNGETIRIGKDIFVTVIAKNDHSGTKIRVLAPKDIRIERIDEIPDTYNL